MCTKIPKLPKVPEIKVSLRAIYLYVLIQSH